MAIRALSSPTSVLRNADMLFNSWNFGKTSYFYSSTIDNISPKSVSIIKRTFPLFQNQEKKIYNNLYEKLVNDSRVSSLFNRTNLFTGTQQKAFSAAMRAYIENIDTISYYQDNVNQIAQKHTSLGVKAKDYAIMGDHLFQSIEEVLGDTISQDDRKAWREGYDILSNMFIKSEEKLYLQKATMAGGWKGFKRFRVIKKKEESEIITSFYLVPEDGSELPSFAPGQYITLRILEPDGSTTSRQYSLSNKPGEGYFRISVTRFPSKGGHVSDFLHNKFDVANSSLEISAPSGNFFLNEQKGAYTPLVFIGSGVGITPLLSMISSSLEKMPCRRISLIQGWQNKNYQAFEQELLSLEGTHPELTIHYCYKNLDKEIGPHGRSSFSVGAIDRQLIERILVDRQDADFYFCGPPLFMNNTYNILNELKIEKNNMYYEIFEPFRNLEK